MINNKNLEIPALKKTILQNLLFSGLLYLLFISITLKEIIFIFALELKQLALFETALFFSYLFLPFVCFFILITIGLFFFKRNYKKIYWVISITGLLFIWTIFLLKFSFRDLFIFIFIYLFYKFTKLLQLEKINVLELRRLMILLLFVLITNSLLFLSEAYLFQSCWAWDFFRGGEGRICECKGIEIPQLGCGDFSGILALGCIPEGGYSLCYGYPDYSKYGYEWGAQPHEAIRNALSYRIYGRSYKEQEAYLNNTDRAIAEKNYSLCLNDEECELKVALKIGEYNHCLLFENLTSNCLNAISLKLGNYRICNKLTNSSLTDDCIFKIISNTKDYQSCNKIQNSERQKKCFEYFNQNNFFVKDIDQFILKISNLNDSVKCRVYFNYYLNQENDKTSPERFSSCLTNVALAQNNISICKFKNYINEKNKTIDVMFPNCVTAVALKYKNEKFCISLLPDDYYLTNKNVEFTQEYGECIAKVSLLKKDFDLCYNTMQKYNLRNKNICLNPLSQFQLNISINPKYCLGQQNDCYTKLALKTKDISICKDEICEAKIWGSLGLYDKCNKLEIPFNKHCLVEVAVTRQNTLYCEDTENFKGNCFYRVAIKLKNKKLCKSAERWQPECYDYFRTKD